jgi:hypothetical protein
MKPSELSSALRRIATAIDQSKKPDRRLVSRDLKKVLAAVSGDVIPLNIKKPVKVDSPDNFSFKSGEPDPELLEHYERNGIDPDPSELESIDHIKQLSNALSKGHIGFEWFSDLVKQELSKAGW